MRLLFMRYVNVTREKRLVQILLHYETIPEKSKILGNWDIHVFSKNSTVSKDLDLDKNSKIRSPESTVNIDKFKVHAA